MVPNAHLEGFKNSQEIFKNETGLVGKEKQQ